MALTGLAACGSATTTRSFQSAAGAVRAIANQPGAQFTVTIKGGPSAFSGSDLTTAQKQAILASSLVLDVHAANGTTLATAGNGGEVALGLTEGGARLAQLEEVGSTLYARVDLARIASTYQLDPSAVAHLRGFLSRYSAQVGGLRALASGQWVSLNLGAIAAFAQAAGITLPSVPQLASQLVSAFLNAVADGTAASSATSAQQQITVNVRHLVTSLTDTIAAVPALSKLSPQIARMAQKAQQAVPSAQTAIVGVTLQGGTVSNLQLPLNQFEPRLNGPVSINVAVAPASAIKPPSGAVAIDLGQIIRVLEGSMAG
jgi:hypothetical protein